MTAKILVGLASAAFALTLAPALRAESNYPACTRAPSKADTEAAHGAYLAGRHSFDEGDYATAVTYFKDSYRRDCTKHELLPIIARAYELAQNRAEALVALNVFVARASPTDPSVDAVKKRIANLSREEPKAASSPPPPVAAPAGPPAEAPSASPLASTPPPAPPVEPKSAPRVAPWIVVGAGGVGVAVGAVVLVTALSSRADVESRCPESAGRRVCPLGESAASASADFDSATTRAIVGGAVAGASLVAMGAGVLWLTLGSRRSAVALLPTAAPRGAGAVLSGSF